MKPSQIDRLITIPGVNRLAEDQVGVTIDAYPVICARLGREPKPETILEEDFETEIPLRPYQYDGVKWIIAQWKRTKYAYLADDLRLGKTIQAIAAVSVVGFKRALVFCPALVLRTWLREILRWSPESSALVLDGRGATKARLFTSEDRDGKILRLNVTTPLVARGGKGNVEVKGLDGESIYWCSTCATISTSPAIGVCERCRADFDHALAHSNWIVCPYDRLIPQTVSDERGREYQRDDLPGWALKLSTLPFDVAIADECHKIRRFDTGKNSKTHRRVMAKLGARNARHRLGLSGTPSFGKFRHLWGQLDWLSDGAYGSDPETDESLPFIFEKYFCNGRKVAIDGRPGLRVWKADETGRRVATEWAPIRCDRLILARRRIDVAKDLPPLIRDVVRVECESPAKPSRRVKNRLDWALARALEVKLPEFVESVLDELITGAKILVLLSRHAAVDETASRLEKAINGRDEVAAEARNLDVKVWNGRGLIAEKRALLIEKFIDHKAPGIFVTTTHSLADGGISMNGLARVHHLEYHDSPMATVQAELRGYEPGISNGYAITHWHATGTIDDEIEERVMPQVEMIAKAFADPTADAMREAFRNRKTGPVIDFESALKKFLGED